MDFSNAGAVGDPKRPSHFLKTLITSLPITNPHMAFPLPQLILLLGSSLFLLCLYLGTWSTAQFSHLCSDYFYP